MLTALTAVILIVSPCAVFGGVDLDGDGNIYIPVVVSLQEIRVRKLAQKIGIPYTPQVIQRSSSVCYDELGCYEKNGTFSHLKQLPEPPEKLNTLFKLFTRKNVEEPQFLDYKVPDSILKSNLNPKLPLKIIAHGFGGKKNTTWVWEMKNAFLKMEDLNIVVVDWSLGARMPYYIQATINTELVGAQIAALYFAIKDHMKIMETNLHVIGFSLGAHVAGFVGKRMQVLRQTRPSRITGLDPAGPLFEDYGGNVHLYKDDADFVDAVHTNADLLMYGGVGMSKAVGHVDHFPNGGKRQPGCGSTLKGALVDLIKGEHARTCNHERAVHLFIDSILDPISCKFVSYRCSNYSDFERARCLGCEDSCGQMGYQTKGSGVYYLLTKAKQPFCAEVAKIIVRFPKSMTKTYGSLILTLIGQNGNMENVTVSGKDERLLPEVEKTFAIPVNDVLKPLASVKAIYFMYNGWFTKGKESLGLASVVITDSKGNYIYRSCGNDVVLKDNEYQLLTPTELSC